MLQSIKEEIITIIPTLIYFCIAFNLIYFTNGIALPSGTVRNFNYLTVTLFSLVVGKVLIVVNYFSFINAFPNKPLIYNITWQFCIYTFCVVLAWSIEELIELSIRYDNIHDAYQQLKDDFISPLFWSTIVWLILVFLIYIIFNEFVRAIGKEKVLRMVFGPK